jgi:hypothetical protein
MSENAGRPVMAHVLPSISEIPALHHMRDLLVRLEENQTPS